MSRRMSKWRLYLLCSPGSWDDDVIAWGSKEKMEATLLSRVEEQRKYYRTYYDAAAVERYAPKLVGGYKAVAHGDHDLPLWYVRRARREEAKKYEGR